MKLTIKINKKRRKKNRLIIFALDIASAFDKIPRKILLKAIEKNIHASKLNNCAKCAKLWTFSTQLLKNREVVYDKDLDSKIKMYSGVPQGGVLSPIFFNITLNYILHDLDEEVKLMMDEGRIMAYADDLVIACGELEKEKIGKLINHLGKHGLHTNTTK